jgi:cytochrome c oxidase subunit 2
MSLPLVASLLAGVSAMSVSCAARAEMRFNFPEPVTPIARDTLAIHNEFMLVITVLFVVVFAIMIYSMARHRKSAGHPPARFTGPTGRIQWFWTLVPFAILLFIDFVLMGIPAFHAVLDMEDTKTRADMVVKVTGLQWKWQYEYPGTEVKYLSTMTTPQAQIDNAEAKGEHYLLEVDNPLVLPVGKKVRVLLTSTDVIHTWWVPQFGVKRDAIPGFLRETWVKIEQPGTYRGQCAELCGKGHGFMPVVVEALPEPEFNDWLARKKTELAQQAAGADRAWSKDELIAHGASVYAQQCAVCHGQEGKGIPGAFPPLSGSKLVLGPLLDAGGKLIADSHLDRVMNGKAGTAMQAFRNTLSPVDLAAVVTYERNALGNAVGDFVQPAQIKALMGGGTAAPAQASTATPPAAAAPPPAAAALPPPPATATTAATAAPKAKASAKASPAATLSKDALIASGRAVYQKHCVACHGAEGKGIPGAFPALSGSPAVNGPLLDAAGKAPAGGHVDRVMNGKMGTPMQAFKNLLDDRDLAAVITFERNALGNSKGDLIQPAQIQSLR